MTQPKVKHLIEYLQNLDPEADVHLDKDGWMEEDCSNSEDPLCVIRERGLFYYRHRAPDDAYLIINN